MSAEPRARLTPPISDRDHTKGPDDSPVTLVEYGDYECQYCGQAENSVHEIQERTGNAVRLVFRHFPNRTVHPHARLAAEAAEAAGAQGKFWEMHDRLFENQRALEPWSGHAEALGLDVAGFESCMTSEKHAAAVRKDMSQARTAGATGTPKEVAMGLKLTGYFLDRNAFQNANRSLPAARQRLTEKLRA